MPHLMDLTYPLDPSQPVFPGDGPAGFAERLTIDRDGFKAHRVALSTHAGTHIDAPAHIIPGGMAVDHPDVLDACAGEAMLFSVRANDREEMTPHHFGDSLGRVTTGSRIILRTGWSSEYGKRGYYTDHPVVSPKLARLLADRGVRLFGTDLPSVHTDASREVHHILLGAGIVIVENLANLERITQDRFFFSAVPLKLTGLDGSPVRAYALVDG